MEKKNFFHPPIFSASPSRHRRLLDWQMAAWSKSGVCSAWTPGISLTVMNGTMCYSAYGAVRRGMVG
jgi:hypothetical protein